jgi:hypothetical protein
LDQYLPVLLDFLESLEDLEHLLDLLILEDQWDLLIQ